MIRKVNITKTMKHDKPRWMVDYRTPDGRRHRKYFDTKGQAGEHAKLVNSRINAENYQSITPLPWDSLTADFMADKVAGGIEPETERLYRYVIDDFGKVCHKPISTAITPQRVDIYKRHIQGNAPTTKNKKLRHLKAIFNWAKKRRYMTENPLEVSGFLREPKRKPRFISPADFQKILDHCTDPQWKVLIHLAVNGVARKNSIIPMTAADIDFENGTVQTWDKKQKEYKETPLHPESMKALTDYFHTLPDGQTNLFTSKFHNTTWQRLLAKAKVPYIRFHDLRTCMSSWMKSAGVSGDVVSKIFGHSTPTLTYQVYTALDDVESKRDAINRLPLSGSQSKRKRRSPNT